METRNICHKVLGVIEIRSTSWNEGYISIVLITYSDDFIAECRTVRYVQHSAMKSMIQDYRCCLKNYKDRAELLHEMAQSLTVAFK
jgi:hypothetical protein